MQPLLKVLSQSISSCSDNEDKFPVTIWFMPSTAATVENAQQLPACSSYHHLYSHHMVNKKKTLAMDTCMDTYPCNMHIKKKDVSCIIYIYIYIYGSSLLQCMNPTWQWGPQIEREDAYIRCMRDVLHRERERELHTTWTLVLDWSNSSILSPIHRLGQIYHISITKISGGPSSSGQTRFQS